MDRSNNPAAKRNKKIVVEKFKGLETVIDSSELGLNVADEARNVSWELDGGISKREGSSVSEQFENTFKTSLGVSYFIKRTVGMIDRQKDGVKFIEQKVKGQPLENIKLINLFLKDKAKTYIYKAGDGNLKIGGRSGEYNFIDSNGHSFKVPTPTYSIGVSGYDEYALLVTNDIYAINSLNELTDETTSVEHDADWPVAGRIARRLNKVITKQWSFYDGNLHTSKQYSTYFGVDGLSLKFIGFNEPWVSDSPLYTVENRNGYGTEGAEYSEFIAYPGSEYEIPGSTQGGFITPTKRANALNTVVGSGGINTQPGNPISGRPVEPSGFTEPKYYGGILTSDSTYNHEIIDGDLYYLSKNKSSVSLRRVGGSFINGGYSYVETPVLSDKKYIIWKTLERKTPSGGNTNGWIISLDDNFLKVKNYSDLKTDAADSNGWTDISTFKNEFVSGLSTGGFCILGYKKNGNYHELEVAHCSFSAQSDLEAYDAVTVYTLSFDDAGHSTFVKTGEIPKDKILSFKKSQEVGISEKTTTPKIHHDTLRDIYIVDNGSQMGFVNDYNTGVIDIPDETYIHTIQNENTYPIKVLLYDKNKNPIGSEIILAPNAEHPIDEADMNKIKYIINLSDEPYALKNLKIFQAGIVTSQSTEIKNWIKNSEKVIGETIDITCVFGDKMPDGTVELKIKYGKDKTAQILGIGGIDAVENSATLYGNVISWTYINDSIIVTTEEDVYVITAIKTLKKSGEVEIFCYVNTIFDMAEKITYNQALANGLNVLAKDPLKIVKTDDELKSSFNSYEDIIITDSDERIALEIRPGETYQLHPQFKYSDPANKPSFAGGWKLDYYDESSNEWKPITDKIKEGAAANLPTTLGPFTKGGQYRVTSTATINAPTAADPNAKKTFKKTFNFNVESKAKDIVISKNKVADEIKKCKYVATLEGRLVLYGNGTKQIYTSEVGNPFYFTASEISVADSFGKSEDIVSINTFKDTQVIFTNTTMMSMTRRYQQDGSSFWSILPLDGVIGAINHKGVCPVENSLSFVGYNGIYLIGQISVAEKRVQLITISEPVRDLVETDKHPEDHSKTLIMEDINSINLEKRLLVSFPEKGYVMVYDYNNAENIAKGKWSTWNKMVPYHMEVFKNELYFLQNKFYLETKNGELLSTDSYYDKYVRSLRRTIFKKNKRLYTNTYEQVDNVDYYYTDFYSKGKITGAPTLLTTPIQFIYSSKESSLGEPLKYKKIKRISITTDNTYKAGTDYKVITTADGHINWDDTIKNNAYKKPSDKNVGFMNMGETITNFFEKENINSISHMKSKNGLVLNIRIVEETHNPFSTKRIYIEYLTSDVKRFKYKNVK